MATNRYCSRGSSIKFTIIPSLIVFATWLQELYQKLYEAPDPAPALAVAFETASRCTDLEAQCKKMAQELAEYKAESAQIRNQVGILEAM